MDGQRAWRDNVFVERLWRSVKYEEVYLRAYDSVAEACSSIGGYLGFYNRKRPHSSLDGRTPDQVYFGGLAVADAARISPPLRGMVPVGLRPPCAVPRNGNRWNRSVGNQSNGTEALFRPSRPPLYLGDDLYSRQPMCEAVLAADSHVIFVCKPDSHPLILEYIAGIKLPTRIVPVKKAGKRFTHRYRWLAGVPLRDGKDALTVNWFEIEIRNAAGDETYRNSFVTDLPVKRGTVEELATCGRTRRKMENETFNTLKTGGHHLEHNYGHGKHNLAVLLVTFNLLAFAGHTLCDHAEELWRLARSKVCSRARSFSRMVAITSFMMFPP